MAEIPETTRKETYPMIDPTRDRQLEELNMVNLCTRILHDSRNELYLNMHFLDISLSSLAFEADPFMRGVGTDGYNIYYNPDDLCVLYRGRGSTGIWPATLPWNPS